MDKKRYDRVEVFFDEKNRALDLSQMNLVPPDVGICDEPTRCYKINKEWAKIVMGMVSWLATVAPWRDAEDETFIGVQEVLTFMIGCDCSPDCEDVWACLGIEESPPDDLTSWLIDQLGGNSDVQETITQGGDGSIVSPLVENVMIENCDKNYLFGFMRQLVAYMNSKITQAFLALEALSNITEIVGEWIDNAPIVAQILDYINFVQEAVIENYFAAWSVELADEYACALLCIAAEDDDCDITWFEVYEYFMTRFGAEFADTTVTDLLTFILAGSWSGTEFCDLAFAVLANIIYHNGEWWGVTMPKLALYWSAWSNDSDSDWTFLCECAYQLVYEYDQAYQNDFDPIQGFWADPYALYSTEAEPYGITIEQSYSSPFDGLQKIAVYTKWSNTGAPLLYLTLVHDSGTDELSMAVADDSWREFELPATRNGVSYIKFHSITDAGISVAYDMIRMEGVGDNPPPDPVNPP